MKALALVEATDHVCCRYRIRAFEPALRQAGWSLTTQALSRQPWGRVLQFLQADRYDAVILQRKLLAPWQLWILRGRAPRLIFDFDDAVMFRDSYDSCGHESPRRAARFHAMMMAADAVIAGNDFLADCALRAGADAECVRVVPTCVDPAPYQPRSEGSGRGDGLDLVWIGSSSTLRGLEMRRSLWDRVGREVEGVRLRVVCDRFPDLGAMPVVPVPWSEATEAEELRKADVGVTWVPDDIWSRGKCGLKVLQYQAAGLPVVANPVGVHADLVRPGETGWLAETPEGWVEAIRALTNNPEGRKRMGRNAAERVASSYSVSAWAGTFVETVAARTEGSPSAEAFRASPRPTSRTRGRAARGSIGAKG